MTLRINIDGNWDAADFAAFYGALDDLYNYACLALERDFTPVLGRVYAFGTRRSLLGARYTLQVAKVQFASPGFTDLVGIAAAMREIREFLQFLIKFASEHSDRRLSRERSKIELTEAKLRLLERLYELEDRYGTRVPLEAEKHFGLKSKGLPNLDPLIEAAIEGRITAVGDTDDAEDV
ncbi:hypothetical protein [Celeribacter baekdonensis]|uniref:hypothetical protein n=1 Tax=Celeribacter baekdonensis TaxID=875171 RepID=UPI003A9206CD